jgi:phosphopantothenate synthetase
MNKNKQKILMYAEVFRTLSKTQDSYIEAITDELVKLYPQLIRENTDNSDLSSAKDWAYDVVNSSNNQEVIQTLDRVDQYVSEIKSENDDIDELTRLRIKVRTLQDYIKQIESDYQGFQEEPTN